MNRSSLFIAALLFAFTSFSQTPNWEWAQSSGGNNYDTGNAIAMDAGGNVYVTGTYLSASTTFGSTVLTNNGNYDIFIVKYSPTGSVLWAKGFGGSNDESATCITVDVTGNVYIAGWFYSSSIAFGSATVNAVQSNISADLFVTKLDASGNVIWARSAGGVMEDDVQGITTDLAGNVYITGGFDSQSISFGTFTLTSSGPGHQVFFIVKYDSSGNAIWGKKAGGISTDTGSGVVTDVSGNVIVTGYYISPTIVFGTTTLTNQGSYDIFTVKYDPSGNVIWAKTAGGPGMDNVYNICLDNNSNIYLAGNYYSDSFTFGSSTVTNSSSATGNILLLKYDSAGNPIWIRSAGGPQNDFGISLDSDLNGNVTLFGWFSSPTMDFGNNIVTSSGPDDLFLVKYDPSGNDLWAINAGCSDYLDAGDIVINAEGESFITGAFYCESLTLGTSTVTNASANTRSDILTAKLNSTLGLDDMENNENLAVFPNPVSDVLTISLKPDVVTSVEVYDAYGRKVISADGSTGELDVSFLPCGLYTIKVFSGNQQASKRFTKVN